ncbi:STAS domain-containing protein [Kitasatospora sp. NPDC101801]|uniref:STAS domain-containing protein n=1 Tax=Kitasatospora sp. NPDC101801 TaxID=3364103 RepID=UPI003811F379
MYPHHDDACLPDTPIRTVTARLGDAALCYLAGTLDFDTARPARTALHRAMLLPCPVVCVDLRDVDFFACAGLNELLDCRAEALRTGRTLVLIAPSPPVLRLLLLSGTRHLFAVSRDVRLALAAYRPNTPPRARERRTNTNGADPEGLTLVMLVKAR